MTGLLVLDFDGVVCDALDECALVSWLGLTELDRAVPATAQLAAVPGSFVRRFRRIRDYARRLDHFAVAGFAEADLVDSQAGFDALFGALCAAEVDRFTTRATAARGWLRASAPEFWLDLHTLYPGMAQTIRRHAGTVAIVTAKDAESVWAILRRHGLDTMVRDVVGDCSRKAEAVHELCARRSVPAADTTFVDDNLDNVLRVGESGIQSLWAGWGYRTAEHTRTARRHGVVSIELSQLARLTA